MLMNPDFLTIWGKFVLDSMSSLPSFESLKNSNTQLFYCTGLKTQYRGSHHHYPNFPQWKSEGLAPG